MWKAIRIVLIYYAVQIAASFAVGGIYGALSTASDYDYGQTVTVGLIVSIVVMALILIAMGYQKDAKRLWNPCSARIMSWAGGLGLAAIVLSDLLSQTFGFLPNLMEDSFSQMESGWTGVLAIVVLGPVLEEMLFRGGVTEELLRKFSAGKAILYSALIFGIFHINPAQIIPATFVGLLLGWLYYKTRSLMPCITVHILNNGLSVTLSRMFPDADSLLDIMGWPLYAASILLAVAVIAGYVRREC